jgi:hypothetical protein
MLDIIIAIILTSAFFILFFKPYIVTKNKRKEEVEESTAHGFIEDTRDAFIIPMYPSQLMDRGSTVPIQGDTGNFVGYSGVSEYNWLHGFPHKKA